MAQVRLEGITKTFGTGADAVHAVDDVTIEVADHEFMVLLGPSGCGKSTLLRMVAGLEDPTLGDVYIGDRRVNDVAPKERDVAMVFQSYALYPHKTVQANIEFPLKVRGVSRTERAAQAKVAAASLGLEGLLDRKPGQLSGGQRQRVALARAIVRHPAVFCMDEPLSNLDAKLRGETRAELVELHARLDSTFLYVTHDQVEAMTMGSRIAVMNAGKLQQVGTPTEVYARPATSFVAQFIGTPPMNLLPAGVLGGPDVIVGIRPEHVRVAADGAHLATVRLVEPLGHETLVTCELVGAMASGTRLVIRLGSDVTMPAVGQDILLDLPEAHRHRFSASTGEWLGDGVLGVKRRLRDVPMALLMLAPSIVILGVFVFYPLGKAVWLGHLSCDATGRRCVERAGWQQYLDVLQSHEFQNALGNTFLLALLIVPAGVIAGVGLAVLADKHLRGIGAFRTIFSSTVATSVAVASLIWFVLLQPQVGLLSDLFGGVFPALKNPGLLNDGTWALPAVATTMVWSGLGFTFIVTTAALQSVPRELYESAYVDGAGGWRRFTNITLPMLSPTLLFIVVINTSRAFQAYGEIDLLTQGGPNNAGRPTETVAYLIYGKSSIIANNIGLKSATSVLLFGVLLILSFIQFRFLERRVQYAR